MAGPSVQRCPEPVALPIIFVPGIMGSRLRNRTTGQIVWDPGTNWSTVWGAFTESAAAKRRRLVGPDGTPFNPRFLEVDMGRVGGTLTAERHRRQWGGLMSDFYMGFMAWLDLTAETPAMGQVPRGCFNLHYEAWAHPYNWTDDNDVAAQGLARTVSRAVAATQDKFRGRNVRVLKPVVVTHSMGGLVARAYVTNHGGAAALHGVIHGAMPTDGAPATYKRMRAGFEGGWGSAAVTQRVLGQSQAEVTATAGNCPGPLQLLPNSRHRSVNGSRAWLRLTNARGARLMSDRRDRGRAGSMPDRDLVMMLSDHPAAGVGVAAPRDDVVHHRVVVIEGPRFAWPTIWA
jgi:pimeloyl-ACP methyl ester carboxylesterase